MLQVKGTILRATSSTKVTRTDAVSLGRYKPKTLELRNTWISSRDIMQQRADAILAVTASPETRYTFGWYVRDWDDFTGLELSDRIQLKMPGYTINAFIENIPLQVPLDQVLPLCTIRATLAVGDVIVPPVATIPSKASIVSLTALSSTSIRVTLPSDPFNGGEPITARDIRYKRTSFTNWTRIDSITSPRTITSLTANTEYEVQWRAVNSIGDAPWSDSQTVTTLGALSAPVFADDMGNAQSWTQSQAISAITVPAASGSPTPTYAAIGALPAGITFTPSTRRLAGTPTALGSGTIRIRATNSQGSDDWTVAYTTTAGMVGGQSVTVPLTGLSAFTNYIRWSDNQSLGSTFDANDAEQILTTLDLNNDGPAGQVFISIIGSNNRFTPAFEATGRIIFEASDGEILEVMIADADMSEAYTWVPTNGAEVVAFVLHIKDLTDQDATLTLSE